MVIRQCVAVGMNEVHLYEQKTMPHTTTTNYKKIDPKSWAVATATDTL